MTTANAVLTNGVVTRHQFLTGIASITLGSGGSGYTSQAPPLVAIAPPTGTNPVQATAVAVMSPSGVVTGFSITNPGSGYITVPSVQISSINNNMTASATANIEVSIGAGQLLSAVTIAPPTSQATATSSLSASGGVSGITVVGTGAGYTSSAGGDSGRAPRRRRHGDGGGHDLRARGRVQRIRAQFDRADFRRLELR